MIDSNSTISLVYDIVSDSTINTKRYTRVKSTTTNSIGQVVSHFFLRCDNQGFYKLLQEKIGGIPNNNVKPVEFQTLKLPSTVGQSWQTDTFKSMELGLDKFPARHTSSSAFS